VSRPFQMVGTAFIYKGATSRSEKQKRDLKFM